VNPTLRAVLVTTEGDNEEGQLGDGTTIGRASPTLVPGLSGVVEIAAGSDFTCARLTDGTVHCWGDNVSGELATGEPLVWLEPATVPVP
jgi:alpha-tubulin suppressor-like RCC1 family protein